MSELKTLKDIEFNAGVVFMKYHELRTSDPFVTKEDLKKEAIKHYKQEVSCEVHTEPKTAFEWIEEFFDLTEEDLK